MYTWRRSSTHVTWPTGVLVITLYTSRSFINIHSLVWIEYTPKGVNHADCRVGHGSLLTDPTQWTYAPDYGPNPTGPSTQHSVSCTTRTHTIGSDRTQRDQCMDAPDPCQPWLFRSFTAVIKVDRVRDVIACRRVISSTDLEDGPISSPVGKDSLGTKHYCSCLATSYDFIAIILSHCYSIASDRL